MNYFEHREGYMKNIKRVYIFLLLNVLLFVSIIIFEMDSWLSRLLVALCIITSAWLIKNLVRKITRHQRQRLEEVEAEVHDASILCYAENYYGLVRKQKYGYLVLMIVFVADLLYVSLTVYRIWISSFLILAVISTIHILLCTHVFFILLNVMGKTVFFTQNDLFLSHSNKIALSQINKYQFLEYAKGGAVLELNTGERYVRLSLEKEEFVIVQQLISNQMTG
ncbi:hypothetical protein [Fusibacter bizertensis]